MGDYISREAEGYENVTINPPISQGIKYGAKSICWLCFHWPVCFAKENQPCVKCTRFVPAADVRPLKVGENITENNPVDEFVCSKCGIILEDWSRVEIDEDDGERTNHEYAFRYCPNCGKPMK